MMRSARSDVLVLVVCRVPHGASIWCSDPVERLNRESKGRDDAVDGVLYLFALLWSATAVVAGQLAEGRAFGDTPPLSRWRG